MNILEIDLKKLEHNFVTLKSLLNKKTKIIGVVKADAYGGGQLEIVKKLISLGIDALAVGYTPEGINLRKLDVKLPIIVFYPQLLNLPEIVANKLEPSLYSKKVWTRFKNIIKENKIKNYPVHIKYNTGLNRLGFSHNDSIWIRQEIKNSPFKIKSIYSHLGESEAEKPNKACENQIRCFEKIKKIHLEDMSEEIDFHILNTSGIFNYPNFQYDAVRIGIGFHGYANNIDWDKKLKPIAKLKSIISQIHNVKKGDLVGYNSGWKATKDTRIAVLPMGHADGISRGYSNSNAWVNINGVKAYIIGNICMDMLMIEIGNISCNEGDEVEIFGESNSANDFSKKNKTIPYELITSIGPRIKRIFLS